AQRSPAPRLANHDDRLVGRHVGDARAQLVEGYDLRTRDVPQLALELGRAADVEDVDFGAVPGDPFRGDLGHARVRARDRTPGGRLPRGRAALRAPRAHVGRHGHRELLG